MKGAGLRYVLAVFISFFLAGAFFLLVSTLCTVDRMLECRSADSTDSSRRWSIASAWETQQNLRDFDQDQNKSAFTIKETTPPTTLRTEATRTVYACDECMPSVRPRAGDTASSCDILTCRSEVCQPCGRQQFRQLCECTFPLSLLSSDKISSDCRGQAYQPCGWLQRRQLQKISICHRKVCLPCSRQQRRQPCGCRPTSNINGGFVLCQYKCNELYCAENGVAESVGTYPQWINPSDADDSMHVMIFQAWDNEYSEPYCAQIDINELTDVFMQWINCGDADELMHRLCCSPDDAYCDELYCVEINNIELTWMFIRRAGSGNWSDVYFAHSDNAECTEIARHTSNFRRNTGSKRFVNCTTAYVHIDSILRALTLECNHVSPYAKSTVKMTKQTATMFTTLHPSAATTAAASALSTLGHHHQAFPHIALPRERGMWDSRLGIRLYEGWKSSNAFRCKRSLLLLCWTATASLACALLSCFTNNRDTSATGCHREASSWGECEVESLILTCRSRIRDLECRFTSIRHMHVGSKPSRVSLSMPLLRLHGWLAGVPFSL